jgi:hypothetical protein
VKPRFSLEKAEHASFDDMMDDWLAMTYVLNSLNRGMGLKDMYPFVLSQPAIEKLRFIHRVCTEPAPQNCHSERSEESGSEVLAPDPSLRSG